MIDWRIYYSDDSTFDSSQGAIPKDKRRGLICIIFYDVGSVRRILHGQNFYYWNPIDAEWSGGDARGMFDRLLESFPLELLCEGRTVSNRKFREIMDRADRDPDFPPRKLD